jgi:hypothetical protein
LAENGGIVAFKNISIEETYLIDGLDVWVRAEVQIQFTVNRYVDRYEYWGATKVYESYTYDNPQFEILSMEVLENVEEVKPITDKQILAKAKELVEKTALYIFEDGLE